MTKWKFTPHINVFGDLYFEVHQLKRFIVIPYWSYAGMVTPDAVQRVQEHLGQPEKIVSSISEQAANAYIEYRKLHGIEGVKTNG